MFFFFVDLALWVLRSRAVAAATVVLVLGHFGGVWDLWLVVQDSLGWLWTEAKALLVGFFDWLLGELGLTLWVGGFGV